MSDLSNKDIERLAEALAPKLISNVQKDHHEFWIDSEQHYLDHIEMRNISKVWRKASMILLSGFLGLVLIGALAMALIGLVTTEDIKSLKTAGSMVLRGASK